jgi:hypothetical protein
VRSPRVYLLLALLLPSPALAQSPPGPTPPTLDSLPPLPPPDTSLPFQAVTDRRPIVFDDSAAYAELLRRARETPAEELDRVARRDVLLSHLLTDPARYRGLPIRLQGTARRVLTLPDVSEAMSPSGRLHEAWVFTADSQGYPYDLVFETPPPGLPAGDQVEAFVIFRGYFLKLMAYRAGDKARVAPLLVGQLEYVPEPSSGALPSASPARSRLLWTALPIAALLIYAIFRIVFVLRRLGRSSASRDFLRRSPRQDITPEALQSWLASPPDAPPLDPDDDPDDLPERGIRS